MILHVVHSDSADGEANLYRALDLVTEQPRRALERLVPYDLGVAFRHALEVGDPETRILEFIARERVELVVMETRQRSAWKAVLGRSLVDRLMQRCACPVVSYRTDNGAQALQPTAAQAPAPCGPRRFHACSRRAWTH